MRPLAIIAAALALAACDRPKPRDVPPPSGPAAAKASAPAQPLSAGLARRPEFPGFYLDHVGQAFDPLNRRPVVTPGDAPLLLDGFGFDPVAKAPARGVDVVIDGKPHGTTYGFARADVAQFHKLPALTPVGFSATLPAGSLAAGPHTVVVRVIAADGRGYFESPVVAFTVE